MKKVVFLFAMLFAISFEGNSQTLKEPVYGTDVTVTPTANSKLHINAGFVFDLGRQSRHCFGFGVCKVIVFWIDIYTKQISPKNQINAPVIEENGLKFIQLELNSNFDSKIYDTNFYVDEDMVSPDGNSIINKGVFKKDSTIGKFGGYKIPVTLK